MARPAIQKLDVIEIEYVAHRLVQELMEYGEPIPPFSTATGALFAYFVT